jgi:cell division protein FtsB
MNPWVEKVMIAIIPLLLSGIVYLFSTVTSLKSDVQLIQSQSALARLQMKVDLSNEIATNRERIISLEEQVKELQSKK